MQSVIDSGRVISLPGAPRKTFCTENRTALRPVTAVDPLLPPRQGLSTTLPINTASADSYTHVGLGFRTAFYVLHEWYPHMLARHSILNLQTVLQNAVWQNPQVWSGRFQDATDPPRLMQSDVPPGGMEVARVEKLRELQKFETSIRERAHA